MRYRFGMNVSSERHSEPKKGEHQQHQQHQQQQQKFHLIQEI